jgi:hypothetical protein
MPLNSMNVYVYIMSCLDLAGLLADNSSKVRDCNYAIKNYRNGPRHVFGPSS